MKEARRRVKLRRSAYGSYSRWANMDFGHTSPQMVVPIGGLAMIDPAAKRVAMLESAVM